MKAILFSGCSYTAGTGFSQESKCPDLWVNLLHKHNLVLRDFELHNVSRAGRSNASIFMDTIYNLTTRPHHMAFVAWTSMPRFEMEIGLETYNTWHYFIPNVRTREHRLNDITYTEKYLNAIRDRLVTLPHPHYEIKCLLYYINSLVSLGEKIGTQIFFINALCPWDTNYFQKLNLSQPEDATEYTKKIINLDNRDDKEFNNLYEKIHLEYENIGGIQPHHWLNLYDSMRIHRIDVNDDGSHPGIKSNNLYFEMFDQALRQML